MALTPAAQRLGAGIGLPPPIRTPTRAAPLFASAPAPPRVPGLIPPIRPPGSTATRRSSGGLYTPAAREQFRIRRESARSARSPSRPSGWAQFSPGNLLATLPAFGSGLVNLGKQFAEQALAIPRTAVDLAKGEADVGDLARSVVSASPAVFGAGMLEQAAEEVTGRDIDLPSWGPLGPGSDEWQARYAPLTSEMGASQGRTLRRATHPGEYVRAWNEGDALGVALEDLGNLSMVGGAVAPVLGGAGRALGGAGRVSRALIAAERPVARAAALGGEVADLGLESAIRGVGRRAARATIRPRQGIVSWLADRAEAKADRAEAATGVRPPPSDVRTKGIGRILSPEHAAARRRIMEAVANQVEDVAGEQARARLATKSGPKAEAASLVEEQAALALFYGDAQRVADVLDRASRAGIPEEKALAVAYQADQPHQLKGHAASPEAMRLAVDALRGQVDPAVQARIDRIVGYARQAEARLTAEGLLGWGYGELGGALDPAELGNDLLPAAAEKLAAVQEKAGRKLTPAERRAARTEQRVATLEGRLPGAEEPLRQTRSAREVRRILTDLETRPVGEGVQQAPDVDLTSRFTPRTFGAAPESALRPVERASRVEGGRQALTRLADRLERRTPAEPGQFIADLVAARDAVVNRAVPAVEEAARRVVEHEGLFDSRITATDKGAGTARRAQQRIYDRALVEAQRGPAAPPPPPTWTAEEVSSFLRRERPRVAQGVRDYARLLHDQLLDYTGGQPVTAVPMSTTQFNAITRAATSGRRVVGRGGWIGDVQAPAAYWFAEFDTLTGLHPDELARLRRQGWIEVVPDEQYAGLANRKGRGIGWDELTDALERNGASLDDWVTASRWEGLGQSLTKGGAFDARKAAGGSAYSGQLTIEDVARQVGDLLGDQRAVMSLFEGKKGRARADAARLADEWAAEDQGLYRSVMDEQVPDEAWRDGIDVPTLEAILDSGDTLGFDSATWMDVVYDLLGDRWLREHDGILRPEDARWFLERQATLRGAEPRVIPPEVVAMGEVDAVLRRAAEAYQADLADGKVEDLSGYGWRSLAGDPHRMEAQALYAAMRRNDQLFEAGSRLASARRKMGDVVAAQVNAAGRLGAQAGRTAGLSEAAATARTAADRGATAVKPRQAGIEARADVTGRGYAAGYRNARLLAELDDARRVATDARTTYEQMKARFDREQRAITADRRSYPSRWRAPMAKQRAIVDAWRSEAAEMAKMGDHAGAALLEEMAQSIPLYPPELAAAGINPGYLPAGRSDVSRPGRTSAGVRRLREAVDPLQKRTVEHERVGFERPYEVREAADLMRSDLKRAHQNELLKELLKPATLDEGRITFDKATGMPSGWSARPVDVLGEADFAAIDQELARAAADERLTPALAEERRNELVAQFMRRKGWAPIDPEASGLEALPRMASVEGLYWPVGFQDAVRAYWGPEASITNPLWGGIRWANRKFKGAVLPFSVRWQLQDIIAAPMMAWVNGGVDPITLQSYVRQAREIGLTNDAMFPRSLHEFGTTIDDAEWLQGVLTRKPRTPIGRMQQRSFALNNAINGMNRRGMFLAKFESAAKRAGFDGVDPTWTYDSLPPRLKEMADQAVRETNDALGDFAKLSQFERRYLKELLPFYTWSRHVVKMTARLAVDHPARLLMLMRIGVIYGPPNDDSLPSYLRYGMPFLGGGMLGIESFNPWADFANNPLLTPQGFLRATSPAIKMLAAATTGADLSSGGIAFTRPPGTGNVTEWGRPGLTPLITRPGELAYVLASQLPQTRALLTIAPEFTVPGTGNDVTGVRLGPIRRYRQGSPQLTKRGERYYTQEDTARGNARLAAVLGAFGIPVPYTAEGIEDIQESYEGARQRRLGQAKAQQVKEAKFAGRLPSG